MVVVYLLGTVVFLMATYGLAMTFLFCWGELKSEHSEILRNLIMDPSVKIYRCSDVDGDTANRIAELHS
jgi:hypothetical protein